jgi:hypothetical protein
MAARTKLETQEKLNIRASMPIPEPSTSAAPMSGDGQLNYMPNDMKEERPPT